MNWCRDRHLEIWFKELCQNLSLVPIPDPRAPPDPLSPMLRPAEYFCVHPVDHVGKLIQLKNKQGKNAFFCQVNHIPNLICWAVEKVVRGRTQDRGKNEIIREEDKVNLKTCELSCVLGATGRSGLQGKVGHCNSSASSQDERGLSWNSSVSRHTSPWETP